MACRRRSALRWRAHARRSSRYWATAPACTRSKDCGRRLNSALGITFVIIKNRRYEALLEFGRHFGLQRTVGTSLPDIDFCALARGQGVEAIAVDRGDALDDALRTAFANARRSRPWSRSPKTIAVERADTLDDALRTAFATLSKPTLVEVAVD